MAAAAEALGKRVLAKSVGEDGMMLWTGIEGALARFGGAGAARDVQAKVRSHMRNVSAPSKQVPFLGIQAGSQGSPFPQQGVDFNGRCATGGKVATGQFESLLEMRF